MNGAQNGEPLGVGLKSVWWAYSGEARRRLVEAAPRQGRLVEEVWLAVSTVNSSRGT